MHRVRLDKATLKSLKEGAYERAQTYRKQFKGRSSQDAYRELHRMAGHSLYDGVKDGDGFSGSGAGGEVEGPSVSVMSNIGSGLGGGC